MERFPIHRALVVGLGVTGRAVVRALARHGIEVLVVDDHVDVGVAQAGRSLGVEVVPTPAGDELARVVREVDAVLPSPGVPMSHPVYGAAAAAGVTLLGEFDLAALWDERPVVAITGTNGKTTVTHMVTEMLTGSGVQAVAAGNTDLPLVEAIEDVSTDVFVVEASSFRLEHSQWFRPRVGTWLNIAPDHLDWHPSHDAYVAAKARLWRNQEAGDVAIAPVSDPLILELAHRSRARVVTFGQARADFHVSSGVLTGPDGPILPVARLTRALPHDIENALAASATALVAGATLGGVHDVLTTWTGLPHRVQVVATHGGVTFVDDSKATAPHATMAAVRGFESVVLIAGGRNKGLDLKTLTELSPTLRAVVAIGEAAGEIESAFAGHVPTATAATMDGAVAAAAAFAEPGDTVLLSPACASFDWYDGYGARGDDFARAVAEHIGDHEEAT